MTPTVLPLLEVREVGRRFGGLVALDQVSFAVEPGEIFGLIGPNGAGKTTLFNLLSGVDQPSAGSVHWRGEAIHGLPPERLNRIGIARTFQNLRLFDQLSVLETVLVALHRQPQGSPLGTFLASGSYRQAQGKLLEEAHQLLDELALAPMAERPAGTLAYGDRRRLEIARALATRPSLLLLDEPAAGMNPREKEHLAGLLATLRQRHDLTLMVIEHHVPLLMQLCHRLAVLNFGRRIALGTPEQIQADPLVIEAYLGVKG
jgi:branched-chain amino acid transport system ATP-binding protein